MFHTETQKELAKWEQFPTKFVAEGLQPGNQYSMREYPKMLYKARQTQSGKWAVSEAPPSIYDYRDQNEWSRACSAAEHFTATCQTLVNSAEEEDRAMKSGEGWAPTQAAALEWRERLEQEIGNAAAERTGRDRGMTEKAKAEAQAAEAEHFGHLPEVPEKPVQRKRGRRAAAA